MKKLTKKSTKTLSARVVDMIRGERSNKYITARTGLTTQQIAAYRAHETMGRYI